MHLYYIIVGGVCCATYAPLRYALSQCGTWRALQIALLEASCMILMVVAAIFAQCGLAGRRYDAGADAPTYDFYHGNWHFLLAAVTCMLYSRVADAAPALFQPSKDKPVCINTLPLLDATGLGLLSVYSVLILVCKEADVNLEVTRGLLGCVCALLFVHACAWTYVSGTVRLQE